MAKLGRQLTGAYTEQKDNFTPIREGRYIVQMIESEIKCSQAGNDYLAVRYEIIGVPEGVDQIGDPEFVGRLVFDNYNLWHSKPDVAQRAWQDIDNVCAATNTPGGTDDSETLHNKPFMVRLYTQKRDGEERTQVGSREALPGAYAQTPAPAPAPQAPAGTPGLAPPAPAVSYTPPSAPPVAPQAPAAAPAPWNQ